MSRWIEFRVIGSDPLPKQSFRALANESGKVKGGFTPARIKKWQNDVGWFAKQAMQGEDLLTGYLKVEFWFVRKTKRVVDFDNLSKAICDAMNKIVYADDNAILEAVIYKRYGKVPGVYVYVEEMDHVSEINLETYSRRK